MKATILYETDFMHSNSSKVVIGVFTNKQKLISAVKKEIKKDLLTDPQGKEGEELKEYIQWNINFFFEKGQTQGLNNFELHSEEMELNQIKK
jgi:hypothetical protein